MKTLHEISEILKDLGVGTLILGGFLLLCFLMYLFIKYTPIWLFAVIAFFGIADAIGNTFRRNL